MKRLLNSAAIIVSLLISLILPVLAPMSASAESTALWPLDSAYREVTTYFDPNRNNGDISGVHNGIDLPAPSGSNIYAVNDGECVAAGWMDAYGYMVILHHEQLGLYTFYAHCSSMAVAVGEKVSAGTVIAYVGNTGMSFGDHLHYGICTNLRGGYPTTYYYDPLTYFSYGEAAAPVDCGCTEDYAGTYTTKGVDTYLNIRSGHSTTSTILGMIMPGEEFNVVKADGKWAHIEHKGVIGCCYMEFIQKTGDVKSGINATNTTCPQGNLKVGETFKVRGNLTSNLIIKRVWGGVYSADGKTPVQTAEADPNSLTYDLAKIDNYILFNALTEGDYVYRMEAEDSSGQKYTIVSSTFSVGEPAPEVTSTTTSATTTSTTTTAATTTTTTKITVTTTTTAKTTSTTTAKSTTTTAKSTTTTKSTTLPTTTTAPAVEDFPNPTRELSTGDLDGDNAVNSSDATFVLIEYAAVSTGGKSLVNKYQRVSADVNGDGSIDSADASAILAFYAYVSTGGSETDMKKWLKNN